jgi:hypothetical protein
MKKVLLATLGLAASALLVGSASPSTLATSTLAPGNIPEGSVINAAVFSIYVTAGDDGDPIEVHRATAAWDETTVTWANFANSYDPAVIDTFPRHLGWQASDLTGLVQGWVDGSVTNQGILLRSDTIYLTRFVSSDSPDIAHRPQLEIWYTPPGGAMTYLIIKRDGAVADSVTDAYIWELEPNYNGSTIELFTGLPFGERKMSLLQFEFSVIPGGGGGCTYTQGYWKNHPQDWPVTSIVIGGRTYTRNQAINLLKTAPKKDKSLIVFHQLVAAKLSALNGADTGCIADTIADADAWMTLHPVGSGVTGGSAAWIEGAQLAAELDDYNRGLRCVPHCD